MTNPNLTEIVFIIDRSGSMQTIADDMRGGFANFVDEQRKLPGECRVTLARFDTEYELLYQNKPIADVGPLVLQPRGGTALLDAIGRTINEVGLRLATTDEGERPSKIVVVVITDGYENASREYSRTQIHCMVKVQREKYAWEFVFMGANQDAVAVGADLGVSSDTALTYKANTRGVRAATAVLSARVAAYRGGGRLRCNQADLDKEQGK